MTKHILLPVRADSDAAWSVGCLARLQESEPIRVHLLSVQQPFNKNVGMYFSAEQMRNFHEEDAQSEMAPVRRALDAARIPYETHVEVGQGAETIARIAQQYNCREIVMGSMRKGGLSELVFGSLARQVQHLMQSSGRRCQVL